MSSYVTEHHFSLTKSEKEKLTNTQASVIWLYGLSGSGKSTIANELERLLHNSGKLTKILDGDGLRHGLNRDLNFSDEDRNENLRRVAEVAKLFTDTGVIVICSFITPLSTQRELVKSILSDSVNFAYLSTNLETCENRDPKGLYKKARSGEIKNFTGIDSLFHSPSSEEFNLDTSNIKPRECAQLIIKEFNLI